MRAVAYRRSLPIAEEQSLIDVSVPYPDFGPRDLVVEVKAISVNPVDVKVRARFDPDGALKILGWDAAGIVHRVGADVTRFAVGDEVFYAGAIDRQGANAEFHSVDERIVGHKPTSLTFAEAAALPLTSLTAWELLFDRFGVPYGKLALENTLLIIGAAGGVGSIAVQLARRLTSLRVIATASRPETQAWVKQLGADIVVDHRDSLVEQIRPLAPRGLAYVMGLTHTEQHFEAIAELLAPEGHFGLIDDPGGPLDIKKLKDKSAALHWEYMFTRARHQTTSMDAQGRILDEIAALVDRGMLQSTLKENVGSIDAANLRAAHALVESGRAFGKVVLSGF
jgi:zinc-binding alcohol dehydrogenase family protein